MPWSKSRSQERIAGFKTTVPAFEEGLTLAKQHRMIVEAREAGLMDQMTARRAFVVNGCHLYGQLLDFDNIVASGTEGETEATHRDALRFLNMHYRIWDAIVEDGDADRIDYHGARMHAIVTTENEDPREQVLRAVALATRLAAATKRVAAAYGFSARIRFGIDQGGCLAMTTGRAYEKDTLFLGAPANYAAKLAALADVEGIFLTPHAQQLVGTSAVRKASNGEIVPSPEFISEAVGRHPFPQLDLIEGQLVAEATNDPSFIFHRATPPLSDVRFRDLKPSNSIRMGMASIFADIDGFTRYVDLAIRQGPPGIKRAATAIHVIREELNAVLRDDFGGKRVRFVGDCIQGLIAEGLGKDDPKETVRSATLCASGMRSSFSLCQDALQNLEGLDLAIGIEYGKVPLTRIGPRGEESVRCAAGKAVVVSERVQQAIEGGGIDLGPSARQSADAAVKRYFVQSSRIPGYDAAIDLLAAPESPAIAALRQTQTARPHSQ